MESETLQLPLAFEPTNSGLQAYALPTTPTADTVGNMQRLAKYTNYFYRMDLVYVKLRMTLKNTLVFGT